MMFGEMLDCAWFFGFWAGNDWWWCIRLGMLWERKRSLSIVESMVRFEVRGMEDKAHETLKFGRGEGLID